MNVRCSVRRSGFSMILAAVVVVASNGALAQDNPTPEVRIQSTPVLKTVVRTKLEDHVEIAVLAMRVRYDDLSLTTNAGQAALKERVANTAKRACARVGTAFRSSTRITSTSKCIDTAVKSAQPQVEAAVEQAQDTVISQQ